MLILSSSKVCWFVLYILPFKLSQPIRVVSDQKPRLITRSCTVYRTLFQATFFGDKRLALWIIVYVGGKCIYQLFRDIPAPSNQVHCWKAFVFSETVFQIRTYWKIAENVSSEEAFFRNFCMKGHKILQLRSCKTTIGLVLKEHGVGARIFL
jgi:hypothetical protein